MKSLPLTSSYRSANIVMLSVILLLFFSFASNAQENEDRPATKLQFSKWSGELNVPDPVAIAFDETGRAFVTQTQRRKIQDLDIREHREWIPNDLSFQTVKDKLEFYRRSLPANESDSEANSEHVGDHNQDGLNNYRDLTVIPEVIHLIEDKNGDGIADSTQVFADDFKTEVTGIAAGVLHHQGAVYATIAPDVWKLRDEDGDGVAEFKEKFATGFGLHIAYAGHDMHGLTVGPDGKIYWSIGDKGISTASTEGRENHFPNQGGVMRCNPDGSEFEVFAHGLRNVQELAFDQYGNLFGFDNDSDQPNEKERFVEIVKGLDAGWRCNYQYRGKDYNPWMAERIWEPQNDSQPLHIIPPIANTVNGPCGFAFNPGTALSPDYKDYFFLTSTLGGEQISFKIQRDTNPEKSDSFVMVNQHQIGQGIPMIGINFGPDGGLYGVDWGGGYPLNQKGAIWKIDASGQAGSKLRLETAKNLRLDYQAETLDSLTSLLASPDQRVRLKAQFELVRRKSHEQLVKIALTPANSAANKLKRIHAIWGVGQLARKNNDAMAGNAIMRAITQQLVDDDDSEIRLQIARTVGDVNMSDLRPIIGLLKDSDPRVRVQAALAFSNSATDGAFEALVEAAKELKPGQTYLRHAYGYALAELEAKRLSYQMPQTDQAILRPDRLEELAKHESDAVRTCAIVALRKFAPDTDLAKRVTINIEPFLNDSNSTIADEAARAIHDDFSIVAAMPDLAATLNETQQRSDAFLRRAINANYRIGDLACLKRVTKFAGDNKNDSEMRTVAIDAISTWASPALLDKVTGRHRGIATKRDVDLAVCNEPLLRALDSDSNNIKVAAIQAIRELGIKIPKTQLVEIFSSKLPPSIRAEALKSLVEQTENLTEALEVSKLLSETKDSSFEIIRTQGLQLIANHKPEDAEQRIDTILTDKKGSTKRERQLATRLLGELETGSADLLIAKQARLLLSGKLEKNLMLETLEALEAKKSKNDSTKLLSEMLQKNRIELVTAMVGSGLSTNDIENHVECLTGGDSHAGKEIFNTHIEAQCSRCHRVGNKGSTVGPNLKGVASRKPASKDPSYLLRSIVAPSAHIVEKYQTIMLLLDTGETVQGVLVSRDDKEIVLADSNGKELLFENDWIEEESIQKTSIMPIAKTLTKREIRDLVAYLNTLKSKPKSTLKSKK